MFHKNKMKKNKFHKNRKETLFKYKSNVKIKIPR